MAYSVPWDESTPIGAITPVSDIDTVIQNVKVSIRERMEQISPGWGNDLVDPKILNPQSINISEFLFLHGMFGSVDIIFTAGPDLMDQWQEIVDIGGLWDGGSPSRITFPSDSYYLLGVYGDASYVSAGGVWRWEMHINGVAPAPATDFDQWGPRSDIDAVAADRATALHMVIMPFATGDYVEWYLDGPAPDRFNVLSAGAFAMRVAAI